jgi:tetratricopeptide (TPR) repeat protein
VPDLSELTSLASRDPDGALVELERARQEGDVTPSHLYFHAQMLSRAGRHEQALTLIDAAAVAFRVGGDELGAARCDAGRSNVLEDLGRHTEAVDAARRWLAWLEAVPDAPDEHRRLLSQARANLGVRLEDAGEYLGALAAHEAAIESMLAAGDEQTAASMEVNRANVLNLLGRSPQAFAALEHAAVVLERAGKADELAVVAINAGESLCRMGRPDDGLQWFARAERIAPEASAERAVLFVETADALASLGALDEAARRYRDAFDVLATLPLAWLEVRAWTGAGRVAAELGRTSEAVEALAEASARHLAAGNLPGWAGTESEALVLLPADSPARRARITTLTDTIAGVDHGAWPVQACLVHLNLAVLETDADVTERHLRRAVGLAERSGVPHLLVRAGQRLAQFLWRVRRSDEAERIAERVLDVAEPVRGRLHSDELLRTFPATIEAAHNTLVDVRLAQGRLGDALALADAGRARAIAEFGPPIQCRQHESGIEDTDAELGAIYDRLLARDGTVTVELRRELDERASRLEARLDPLAPARMRSRRHFANRPPDAAEGELQVIYHVSDGQIGMFVRQEDDTVFCAGLADLSSVVEELAALHSVGRRAVAIANRPGEVATLVTAAADAPLRRLGERLLGPVVGRLDGTQRLVVVPRGILHGVPFHALEIDGSAVMDRVEVTVTPSLTIRATRPGSTTGPTLLVGCGGRDLSGVEIELGAIQALRPEAVVLREADATVAEVMAAMRGASCIHLASHGIFRKNAPMASGMRLADGWLTARQTARLDLAGATVVLSACDTGRSVVNVGEELLGLQRGFLLAGAHALVMTHWAAVDEAAVSAMTEFHRCHGAGLGVAAATRAAWIATRRRHPHPWWWASFFTIAP